MQSSVAAALLILSVPRVGAVGFLFFFSKHRKPMVHILLADTGSPLLSARMLWFRQGMLPYWSEII